MKGGNVLSKPTQAGVGCNFVLFIHALDHDFNMGVFCTVAFGLRTLIGAPLSRAPLDAPPPLP